MMNIKYKKYTSHRISAQNITYHCYYCSLKASGINSLAFCLLYGPVLTTVRNHWEDHQFSSVAQSCPTLCDPMDCSTPDFLSFILSWSWFKLMSIKLMMSSNHLILCRPLLLPSIFPSIRVFSNESALHIWWPECWSFSFSIFRVEFL